MVACPVQVARRILFWMTDLLHVGYYTLAFWIGVGVSAISALAIWRPAPGKNPRVGGNIAA